METERSRAGVSGTAAHAESDYLFGLYEPGGEQIMLEAGRPGWLVFNEVVGHDADDRSGVDFSPYSDLDLGVICQIEHGHEPDGTLPHSSRYEQFARRVANFVATSRGCKIWVIGREMNYAASRSGIVIDWSRHQTRRDGPPDQADPRRRGVPVRYNALPDNSTEIRTTRGAIVSPGEVITPDLYVRCYRLCRDAIRRLSGHEDDQVLVGAVTPWNSQTIYNSNPNGDWVQYFVDILRALGPEQCDGFTLHTFARGGDPGRITADDRLGAPFAGHHASFRAYMDFMQAVPAEMRTLPAYITECDQIEPWANRSTGWIQQAYAEIERWNREPQNQPIRCLALYRWSRRDKWYIEGKQAVIDDLRSALQQDYRWRTGTESAATPPAPRARPEPAPPYRVEWLDDRVPRRLYTGTTVAIMLQLRNSGSRTWNWGGGNPFRLGYAYYRGRRRLDHLSDDALRTDIPDDVAPGETVTIQAQVALPDAPGNYTIRFDMVHEGVTWFDEQGSPPLTRWLTVEPDPAHATGAQPSELPVPLFKDVVATLPRGGAGYARRSLDRIRHLVISHTGVDPRVRIDALADAHIRRGYPGIVYDYLIDPAGQIYKVTELEDVAEPAQEWSAAGVNICLSGDFRRKPPPLPQIDAAGRLCAWLARNLDLDADAIIGLGELTRSSSPGRSFYHDSAWRESLRRQVRLHLAVLSSGAESQRSSEQESELNALRDRNQDLSADLDRLQRERREQATFAEQLQRELADAQRQLRRQVDDDDGRPRIQDVVQRLPRDRSRYTLRTPDVVRYVVINQTGAPPETPLERLAESHMPDWPGLLYDFVIDLSGTIFQTQPLAEVVDTGQPYLGQAVNVAFAGTFDDALPANAQIHAGGRLLAWLLGRYPHLTLESIKGLSEFIEHPSPGQRWLGETGWKEQLLAAVRRSAGLVDPSALEAELRAEIVARDRRIQQLQHNVTALQELRGRLSADNESLRTERAQNTPAAPYTVPQPPLRIRTPQLPRHPSLRYDRRPLSQITHIAVHHTATLSTIGPDRIAEIHVNADAARGKEPWPGIGYHYFVGADGVIAQTNDLETVSYHVFQHDSYTVGIAFAGSFMNGKSPTSAQLRAGAHLIAWLMQEHNIPLARVWGHKDFPDNITICPGSEWTDGVRWREQLFHRIEEIRRGVGVKALRHYLLFWQRPYPGPLARQDFVNAIGYVARFRPSLGFSVADARNAEYVTIVGAEAGIAVEIEEELRSHGCKVERIAGRNEEETGRMLTELARQGRRFRTFEVDF